jgi:signal peptide peptidase SppA
MAKRSFLSRFIPPRFRKPISLVHVVRLHGAIGMSSPLRGSLTAKDLDPLLEKAFIKGVKAVALSVNSPGGSPVQSALIHARIRSLAEEFKIPVYVFCEDVAASGGYWLACAGDEIYADESSIIGSIGVVSAGFGFVKAIGKLGVERRVHTAGENKSILDPFQPQKPEDVTRLLALQKEIHLAFKTLVRTRRAGKLKGKENEMFSGAFWAGRQAQELGLVDGIGHMHDVLKQKFGKKLVIKNIAAYQGWGLKRLGFGTFAELPAAAIETLETRALWAKFGL